MSHPTWVRGLKHAFLPLFVGECIVAPYVGAWIETCPRTQSLPVTLVAPYVGAWIETLSTN